MDNSDQLKHTLTRACDQCVKIKRRCTRDLPHCRRCEKRKTLCSYRNEPLTRVSHRVTSRTATTKCFSGVELMSPENRHVHSTKSQLSRSWKIYHVNHQYRINATALATLRFLGSPELVSSMAESTVNYLFGSLRDMIGTFSSRQKTPFIHAEMYKDGLPPLLRTFHSLCSAQTSDEKPNIIHEAISKAWLELLLCIPSSHTFTAKLTLTHSLILLQIITLFTPTTPLLLQQAEHRIPLLQRLARELYCCAPSSLPSSMSRYQAYLLAESCRRTIHVANIIDELHSMLTRGTYTVNLSISVMPIDRNGGLWDCDVSLLEDGEYNVELDQQLRHTELISYRELLLRWDGGMYRCPTPFDEILIVVCVGVKDVRQSPVRLLL